MTQFFAQRASALVGVRFRAQGRDAATGLDCAGLAIAAYALPVERFRRDYRLRGDHGREILTAASAHFRRVARTRARAGDLLLVAVAHDQLHLAIKTARGFIHADARRGRVVETPGAPPWPLLAVLRRRVRQRRSA